MSKKQKGDWDKMKQKVTGKAYGKINLALDVTGKREDGYHLVRMIMQTVDIYDTVTIEKTEGEEILLSTDSGSIPSGPSNLVWRAADVMRREYGWRDGLHIHLDKRIPIAAGMAGGSADAAAVFRLLRELYEAQIPDEKLRELALPLGADIPYCIGGGTQLCEGIGEVLTGLPTPPQNSLLVCKPDLDVSTAWVYREYDSIPADEICHPDVDGMADAIRKGNLENMCRLFGNVLEQKTGAEYPVIGRLEQFFLDHGALGSIMTGSGPTVFAVYDREETAGEAFEALQREPEFAGFQMFRTRFVSGRESF